MTVFGGHVTGGQRPLLVGGVAGGVGTSTFARVVQATTSVPVYDLSVYRGGLIDLLITSNTATTTAQLGRALALCPRPPVLIVMHTVPGGLSRASGSHLRVAEPHLCSTFEVFHQRQWPELEAPPGSSVPKPVMQLVRALPAELRRMYEVPARQPAASSPLSDPGFAPVPSAVVGVPSRPVTGPQPPWGFSPRAGPPGVRAGSPGMGPVQQSTPQPRGLRTSGG